MHTLNAFVHSFSFAPIPRLSKNRNNQPPILRVMNKFIQKFGLWSVLVFVVTTASAATVITTNTAISPINPGYDGTDLVISNCTVTLDGPHSFNSLLIASGGVL